MIHSKSALLALAHQSGFDDCRIAPAQRAAHADWFEEWLAHGYHGTMAWMERDPQRRADPRIVLPGARSVIVLAINYYQATPALSQSVGMGKISRYAWGDDYHGIVEKRIKPLMQLLNDWGGTQRRYVDYGPILERDFASESGLGWNGKSTVQIHPKLGTWFFLAEILTDLEFEPDPPMPDRCGRCTRCVDACPTAAILPDHKLDARRCISYLTIEHHGPIPEEFRRAIGDRIYGCDDCLEICPWNRFAQTAREEKFAAREYVHDWPLRKFLSLSDEQFRILFRKSPILRIKRTRFLRNVCIALGNVGEPADIPPLQVAANDPDPTLAEAANWAIQEITARSDVSDR